MRTSTAFSCHQLELPFLERANAKSETLRASVQRLDTSRRYTVSVDMSFIEEAIRELLASRRILIASYAFGYYVEGNRGRRMFENIQVCLCVSQCVLSWHSWKLICGTKKVLLCSKGKCENNKSCPCQFNGYAMLPCGVCM